MTLVIRSDLAVTSGKTKIRLGACGVAGVAFQSGDKQETTKKYLQKEF